MFVIIRTIHTDKIYFIKKKLFLVTLFLKSQKKLYFRRFIMEFKTDIEIAQEANPQDIRDIAKKINLSEDDIELYGKYKAKIDYNV